MLLLVLQGLPVSGSVCAVVCVRADQAMPHHHHQHTAVTSETSAQNGHESSTSGPSLTAAGHDCRTQDGMLGDATESLTAVRGDVHLGSMDAVVVTPALPASRSMTPLRLLWGGNLPSFLSPPLSRTVVLRI